MAAEVIWECKFPYFLFRLRQTGYIHAVIKEQDAEENLVTLANTGRLHYVI